jgi:hypothetical protein
MFSKDKVNLEKCFTRVGHTLHFETKARLFNEIVPLKRKVVLPANVNTVAKTTLEIKDFKTVKAIDQSISISFSKTPTLRKATLQKTTSTVAIDTELCLSVFNIFQLVTEHPKNVFCVLND